MQVADLQVNLKQEQIIVEEKKAKTGALIETIGQEKAVVDEAVEAGREDEEAAAKLQVTHLPHSFVHTLSAQQRLRPSSFPSHLLSYSALGESRSQEGVHTAN